MDITTLGAAVAMAKKVMPQVTSADAGKLATVDSNGKWAAADLEVGQGEVAVDSTLLVSGAAADAKVTGDKLGELKSAIDNTVGEFLFSGNHAYSGNGNENWFTFIPTAGSKIAIILTGNTTETFELAVNVGSSYPVFATIKDSNYHIVQIPSGASDSEKLIINYKGTTPVTISCRAIDAAVNNLTTYAAQVPLLFSDINEINYNLDISKESYGNNGITETTYQSTFLNFTACPCKRAEKNGKVTSIYVKSYSAGTTKLYVGEVDQLYLFVPRAEYNINVAVGENNIDVSDMDIYMNVGEQLLFKFISQTPFERITGEPEDDNSFYYGTGGMQLQVYGAQYAAVFGFGYTVQSSVDNSQNARIEQNTGVISTLQNDVSDLQANINVLSDESGNKYKMIVRNGEIVLLPLEFSHILCVGNSYTVHPTTTDSEPDYSNNLWWGHWSMAATASVTAWTKLLQDVIREKDENAVVTPVFGRRYETNPTTYNLSNANTFTYWDGTAWQSLANNLSDFTDVDAVVFFLGANYSGDDWQTLYSEMIDKYRTWFPNASVFCCSCSFMRMDAKDTAIQNSAAAKDAKYINMVGTVSGNKLGAYVKGDDGALHQISNSAVAGHYGDYGQYLILNRICDGIGYANSVDVYDISVSTISGVDLSVVTQKELPGAVVSVFADIASGATLAGLTVTDSNENSVTVTDHGATDYGRIFTFIMPNTSVSVVAY